MSLKKCNDVSLGCVSTKWIEVNNSLQELTSMADELEKTTRKHFGEPKLRVNPRELCRSMAAEAEASRESDAKIVCAEGEKNALLALRLAADELSPCPTALQLRYIQTLSKVSNHDNHTIVIPFPMNLI